MRIGALRIGGGRRGGARVFGISPAHGAIGGGTAVTISGRGFTGMTSASVGGANIGAFAVVDDSTITGTTAAGAHGYQDVSVTGGPPGTITLGGGFHYDQNPTVTSVIPNHGPVGGAPVEIHGSGMTGMTGAIVGGNATGPDFNIISDLRIDTEVDAHAWGDVDVTVNGVFGETGTLLNGFHYDQALAHVNTVSPDHGTTAGGTTLQIDGTNFLTATGVKCGDGTPFTNLQVFNDLILYADTPAHAPGLQNIIVTNDSGDSAPLVNAYNFQTPPFDPASLPLTGYWIDHTAAPWVGKASAGTSGSHNLTTVASADGAALSGHTTADYASALDTTAAAASVFYSNGAYSGAILFNADSAGPDTGGTLSPYFKQAILAHGSVALFGVAFSTAGVDVWAYDGTWHTVRIACGTGGWHLIEWKYDGTNLQARLDGGSWATPVAVTSGWGGFSITNPIGLGSDSYGGAFDGRLALVLLADSAISDANFDNIKTWVNTTFGLSL